MSTFISSMISDTDPGVPTVNDIVAGKRLVLDTDGLFARDKEMVEADIPKESAARINSLAHAIIGGIYVDARWNLGTDMRKFIWMALMTAYYEGVSDENYRVYPEDEEEDEDED